MKRFLLRQPVAGAVLAGALCATSSAGHAKSVSFLDLELGGGYSTNPALLQDSESSAFGRVSASGFHGWESERGRTSISGYVENTTYLSHYGSKQLFSLTAHTDQNVSPNVTVYGDLGFSGDFAGQLSNRFLSVPSQPPVIDPTNPLPPPTTLPDILGFNGRQYRLNGQVGASIKSGPLSTISLSAGAQRIFFSGHDTEDLDYNVYFASAGYSRQVSERTSVGGTVYLQRQDFSHGDYSNVVNPVLTFHTQLSERISADAAAGVLYIEQSSDGHKDDSWSPSFSGSLCRLGDLDRFCAHIARDAQSSLSSRVENGGEGHASVTTTGGLDYFRRLGEGQTLQLNLSAAHYSRPGSVSGLDSNATYLSGVAGYDRKIRSRLYGGVSVGARKLFQDGPDGDTDLNGRLYIRYRLGDLL